MFAWENVKNPTEVKRYAFDWSEELASGDTIASCSAVLISGFDAGLTIIQSDTFDGAFSYVKVGGGTAAQSARIAGTVVTVNGETLTEVGVLTIAEPSDPATSELQDLRADLVALRKARITLLTGGQIKEVWRDGRRLVYNVASLDDVTKAIHDYESLIAVAEAAAASTTTKPRFRALRPRF